jgi:uncharacterized nucleotidyltransferase DUF6036
LRREADPERIERFMERLGREARGPMRIYFTGGATAVLLGWRPETIDVDVRFEPERSEVFAALPRLKIELDLNIELASPQDFLPELPGWRDRSRFVAAHGEVQFFHYDFYAQTLAKIERGHARDLDDVRAMFRSGLVDPGRLVALLDEVRSEFGRYPAVDFEALREQVEAAVRAASQEEADG